MDSALPKLRPTHIDKRDDLVVIILSDENGNKFEVPLSVFDISTLVTGLYAERDGVLTSKVMTAPEAALPLAAITVGQSQGQSFLRITVGNGIYHDFFAPANTSIGALVWAIGDMMERAGHADHVPWDSNQIQ